MLGLADKRVLVTGASRGIGRVVALELARAGAAVVACHRTEGEAAASLARELKEYGEAHRVVPADVTIDADVAALVAACHQSLGGLDGVVNNVGVDGRSPIGELAPPQWQRMLDANLTSQYRVTRAALPLLAGGGSIVNLGASVATRGRPGSAHYAAAKAGVIGLTRSLAKELGPQGIRVNAVAPGVVDTAADDDIPPPVRQMIVGMTALGRLGTPADVAGAVLYLLSDIASYVTGVVLNVDGGM
jgi:3-oxoacyl-[acyl-carrier protein] reductase